MLNRITLVAHRGYSSLAPENTIAAFQLAVNRGYKDIEFDVQLTKDGVPIIIHDSSIDRTTNGKGAVNSYTYEDIKKLDAGAWFSSEYKGHTIPSLQDVLTLLRGKARLHIELKSTEPELSSKVTELLSSTGWLDDVNPTIGSKFRKPKIIISSYDRPTVLRSMELLSLPIVHEIIVDTVTDEGLIWASEHGLYSYHPDGKDITPELIKKAAKLKLHIGAWWWTREEQDVRAIKGARYAFVDSPHEHHRRPIISIRKTRI